MPQNTGNPLFDIVNDAVLSTLGDPVGFAWSRGTEVLANDLEGIYIARHYEAEVGGQVTVSEYTASLGCRRADVKFREPDGIAVDDTITLRGSDFLAKEFRPDSEGWLEIMLVAA